MNHAEKEDYETLQDNQTYLYDYCELLYEAIHKDPIKWKTFITLTNPLMGQTLEMIIAQGPDPRWK